ncbi:LEAF RUST 10 DISEASE-RESISTANCE LOCUS RECEPTOR-LIKE PROTEIN KINASE-like 2.7 [Rhodamnia argentea]|uniref:non-specific serine/threonine protein kinase n=1 Tax=Rhodamnia argentea TaxID=178133 RepID=A0ABM3GYE8_9MYRT|nr:LEAF RUST 10 DISEASE-RESISTANCE LOCUS RECEPTOR-LIKE PROTEIN KINASE-like 2.7 [Rhodamnia argentea]
MHPRRRPFRDLSLGFLIATALILVRAPAARGAVDPSYLSCSSTISCGVLQNASYPFWGLTRASYCGLPDFQVTCLDNTTPLLNISNQNFRVLQFNDTTKVMTVAREDYWNTICPTSFVNTTQEITSSFSYTSDTLPSNLTLYYGCGGFPNQTTIQITLPNCQFNCTINGTNVIGYFITKKVSDIANAAAFSSYFGGCNSSVVLPATQSAIEEIQSSPSNTTVVSAIDEGFGLQWTVDETCISCHASGGQCGRKNRSGEFLCYCQDKSYSSTCSGTSVVILEHCYDDFGPG